MINNLTLTKFSLKLLLISPFITRPIIFAKTQFNSFLGLSCIKSSFSLLYSNSDDIIKFHASKFSKFNGQSPIYLTSYFKFNKYPRKKSVNLNLNEEEILYENENYSEPQLFYSSFDTSVSFSKCTFIDCVNSNGNGGAICFRKSEASLNVIECQFLRCLSFQSAGAIYVIQLTDSGWLQGNFIVKNCLFEECYDCNSDPNHDYVCGVIEASIAKGESNYRFFLDETSFLNCQFNQLNRITEGQIRLMANLFKLSRSNFSNKNDKIDLSAVFFNKFVQEKSEIEYLVLLNQRGFTSFEFYDIESAGIELSNIAIVNTTFVNCHKGTLIGKIGFMNVFFKIENALSIDSLFLIDFTTIATDQVEGLPIVQPQIIVIHDDSNVPETSAIFSNQEFTAANKIPYELCLSMSYDFVSGVFDGMNCRNVSQTLIDVSELPHTPIDEPTNKVNNLFSDFHPKNEKIRMKKELIIVIADALFVVLINIVVIAVILIRSRRKQNLSDEQIDGDSTSDVDSNNQTENDNSKCFVNYDYELFFNPKKKLNEAKKMNDNKSFISILLKNDPFKNDFEEIKTS